MPTAEHGDRGRDPRALRIPADRNRVEVTGFGVLPCAGLCATVLEAGTDRGGDEMEVLAP